MAVQNISLLTTWPKSAHPPKHYKNRGFNKAFFEKQMCITKRPFLDKKTKPEIPVIIILPSLFSFNKKKTQTLAETPIFIV